MTCSECVRYRRPRTTELFWPIFGLAFALASGLVWAHEGHKALPTKGARVDGDTVTLTAEAHRALGLSTAEVFFMDLKRTLTATARVVAPWRRHALVTTRVSGRIENVFAKPGDFVEARQKLAEVESLELENEQLELIQFELELEFAKQTLDRIEKLGGKGIVPEKDIWAAKSDKLEKASALEITKRKLIGLGLSEKMLAEVLRTREPVRSLPIHSTITGVVVHSDVNVGKIVEPTDHLFEILDLRVVWVKGMVVESETYRLKKNQPVRVSLAGLPGQTFEGKIDYIALQVDAQSRALPVWVVLENVDGRESKVESPEPERSASSETYSVSQLSTLDSGHSWRLLPGMFGRIQIMTDEAAGVVACPTAALVKDGAETYVFVEQKPPATGKPGEYLKRNVVLGLRTPELVEVKEGLFPGDRVVLQGSHELSSFFVQGVLVLTPEAQRNIKLQLQPVQQRQLENVVTINATVEVSPDRKALASSRILGKISRILVDLSQSVRAGQTLAEVESLEFQDLQLDLIQTQTRLALAKDLLEQARQVKTVIAQKRVLQLEIEYRKMENYLGGYQRKLQAMGLTPEDVRTILKTGKIVGALPVRSPIDGFVVHFEAIPGQVVRPEEPVFEIHNLSKMWVRGDVFERDLSKVHLGRTVRIRLVSDPDFLGTAKLIRTNHMLTGSARILSVWAELDNQWVKAQPLLKDEMLARMTISAGMNSLATAVPVGAVLTEGAQTYVFVKRPDKDNAFERRQVELGHRDDRYVQIERGLQPGEMIAVGGVQELRTAYASLK